MSFWPLKVGFEGKKQKHMADNGTPDSNKNVRRTSSMTSIVKQTNAKAKKNLNTVSLTNCLQAWPPGSQRFCDEVPLRATAFRESKGERPWLRRQVPTGEVGVLGEVRTPHCRLPGQVICLRLAGLHLPRRGGRYIRDHAPRQGTG